MSRGSGSSGSVTQTQTQTPWEEVQPYLKDIYSESERQYRSPSPSYFPHSTVTPFATETEQALQGRAGTAGQIRRPLASALGTASDFSGGGFNPLTARGRQTWESDPGYRQLTDTTSGQYLNNNPYLDATYDMASRRVRGDINSMFSGNVGSGINQEVMGRTLGDIATGIYGGDYQQERGRQLAAAGQVAGLAGQQTGQQMGAAAMVPALAQQQFMPTDQLAQVGATRESLGEAQLQDAINRFNFEEQKPFNKLNMYSQYLGNAPGGQVQSTQPVFRNRAAGGLGGAATGAGIANLLGVGGGWGAGLAGLGGLLGMV